MSKTKIFIRNMESGRLLESFLVSAVAAILCIRFFLAITDYPQIGSGRFHIAHMLWGGLLMMVALTASFAFFGKFVKWGAAIAGGVGFGLFIDELGKFITRSNNYFYQPAVAIIYVIFILLFLGFRRFQQSQTLDHSEVVANAIDLFEEGAMYGLNEEEKNRALGLLKELPETDHLLPILKQAFESLPLVPASLPGWYVHFKEWLKKQLLQFSHHMLFIPLIVGIIIFQSILKTIDNVTIAKQPVLFTVFGILGALIALQIIHALQNKSLRLKTFFYLLLLGLFVAGFDVFLDNVKTSPLTLQAGGEILASTASACLAAYGALRLKWNRLNGFLLLERAVLVSIFITQFFTFYRAQLNAILGLTINLILLVGLQNLIKKEKAILIQPS
jgi:hypothetical protein